MNLATQVTHGYTYMREDTLAVAAAVRHTHTLTYDIHSMYDTHRERERCMNIYIYNIDTPVSDITCIGF